MSVYRKGVIAYINIYANETIGLRIYILVFVSVVGQYRTGAVILFKEDNVVSKINKRKLAQE